MISRQKNLLRSSNWNGYFAVVLRIDSVLVGAVVLLRIVEKTVAVVRSLSAGYSFPDKHLLRKSVFRSGNMKMKHPDVETQAGNRTELNLRYWKKPYGTSSDGTKEILAVDLN